MASIRSAPLLQAFSALKLSLPGAPVPGSANVSPPSPTCCHCPCRVSEPVLEQVVGRNSVKALVRLPTVAHIRATDLVSSYRMLWGTSPKGEGGNVAAIFRQPSDGLRTDRPEQTAVAETKCPSFRSNAPCVSPYTADDPPPPRNRTGRGPAHGTTGTNSAPVSPPTLPDVVLGLTSTDPNQVLTRNRSKTRFARNDLDLGTRLSPSRIASITPVKASMLGSPWRTLAPVAWRYRVGPASCARCPGAGRTPGRLPDIMPSTMQAMRRT